MQVIIDKFEGDFAVVELPDKTTANLPKVLIPEADEGDVLDISVNKKETEERTKTIRSLMKDVWN